MNEEQLIQGAQTSWVVRPDRDLEDLIPSFLENRKRELAEMVAALARSDYEIVRRMAHTWKGICRPYGFVHLETLSKKLEVAGEAENAEEAKSILQQIDEYLSRVQIVYEPSV